MTARIRTRLTATIEGVLLMNEIVEITAPKIETQKQEIAAGFCKFEEVVGVEKLEWTIKIQGSQSKIRKYLGDGFSESVSINIEDLGKENGRPYKINYEINGPITSIEEDALKHGELSVTTIGGTAKSYKHTDTGVLCANINVETGVVNLGGGDIIAAFS